MDPEVWKFWKNIADQQIANNGQWVAYTVTNETQNPQLELFEKKSKRTYIFPRAKHPRFTEDSQYLIFDIIPDRDTVKELKRKKVKKDKLPKNSLAILRLSDQKLTKIPRVTSYILPKYWNGYVAITQDPDNEVNLDSTQEASQQTNLLVWQLAKGTADTITYIDKYSISKNTPNLVVSRLKQDSTNAAGIYYYNCPTRKLNELMVQNGKYEQMSISPNGEQIAYLLDQDTTDNQIRPFDLFYWNSRKNVVQKIANAQPNFSDYRISEKGKISFSENNSRLFFGLAEDPILSDTSLLPEEIVEVEVWTTADKNTYPQQKKSLNRDKNKTFDWVYNVNTNNFLAIGAENVSGIRYDKYKDGNYALLYDETPGLRASSWEGFPIRKDVNAINLNTGETINILKNLATTPYLSPQGKYAYWYNRSEDSWYNYDLTKKKMQRLAGTEVAIFNNELHDTPIDAYDYGRAGWTSNDAHFLVYDRYDIWQLDPRGKAKPKRLTNGRTNKIIHRLIRTDRENNFYDPAKKWLLHTINEETKAEAYHLITNGKDIGAAIIAGDFRLSPRPALARDSEELVYSRETFNKFPDLYLVSNYNFENAQRISEANPQQGDYSWGGIELKRWLDYEGQEVTGMIVKPENFDPTKKYPLIVNFYERSSNRLHRHRAPYPHRSTINYTYYANRGYIIFNPDVSYLTGAPGESAYRSVMSGVDALIVEGYIDEKRMALQGHSWGGYQIAYLLTRTNRFVCAESGAPVVNMTSAYGGIRWGTGLSRMFQYEKTQSRLGSTLWEDPQVYIDNSPLFELDKMETPVLILHNDQDGAVPWYQGIEYFVALRRLDKPAWFLNYNGEPHWPLKRQNREDFQIRMSQFFDHYLMGQAKPLWMVEGVPAMEMGIDQGLELSEEK